MPHTNNRNGFINQRLSSLVLTSDMRSFLVVIACAALVAFASAADFESWKQAHGKVYSSPEEYVSPL